MGMIACAHEHYTVKTLKTDLQKFDPLKFFTIMYIQPLLSNCPKACMKYRCKNKTNRIFLSYIMHAPIVIDACVDSYSKASVGMYSGCDYPYKSCLCMLFGTAILLHPSILFNYFLYLYHSSDVVTVCNFFKQFLKARLNTY